MRTLSAIHEGIPEGFVARPVSGGFMRPIGPIWVRPGQGGTTSGGTPSGSTYGLLVEERHCNGMAMCHGGMLATLVDVVLGIGGLEQAGTPGFFVTIGLTTDFLAPVPLGSWIEAEVELLRRTRTMMFTQAVFRVGDAPVMRASGVFQLPRPAPGSP